MQRLEIEFQHWKKGIRNRAACGARSEAAAGRSAPSGARADASGPCARDLRSPDDTAAASASSEAAQRQLSREVERLQSEISGLQALAADHACLRDDQQPANAT
jgi:hypothetical protein